MEKKNKKLWGGRFEGKLAPSLQKMGASISYDKALWEHDLRASQAHAKMLQKIGILTKQEVTSILKGLNQIGEEIQSGRFEFTEEKEDIHMHVESRLTELIGEAGKKLHTARSRNDQVGQDVRLYLKSECHKIQLLLQEVLSVLYKKAEDHIDSILPGYTHLQIAQPLRASHYFLAHFWAFLRDWEEFESSLERSDELVLGSGALAGVNYPTDRVFLQKELSLKHISHNSLDAVSHRDHILKFLFACVQTSLHASRFAEEIIIFTSVEFGTFSLPDALTTGSSIMPQKKNPDLAELIRGRAGRMQGAFIHTSTLMKGTPLAYNRDFQEDKLSLFQASREMQEILEGVRDLVEGIRIQSDRIHENLLRGFATATDLADHLVRSKKIPFREAHEIVGELVKVCVAGGWNLETIPAQERSKVSPCLVEEDYSWAIQADTSADKKDVMGGTAKGRQKEQMQSAKKVLSQVTKKTTQRKTL